MSWNLAFVVVGWVTAFTTMLGVWAAQIYLSDAGDTPVVADRGDDRHNAC